MDFHTLDSLSMRAPQGWPGERPPGSPATGVPKKRSLLLGVVATGFRRWGGETAAGDDFTRGDRNFMSKAVKYAEKAVVYAAKGAWAVYERLNRISQIGRAHV